MNAVIFATSQMLTNYFEGKKQFMVSFTPEAIVLNGIGCEHQSGKHLHKFHILEMV